MEPAKLYLINWFVLLFLAIILWYRNISIDRYVAPSIVILALIQLIYYGLASYANVDQAYNCAFVLLWMFPMVLAFGVDIYFSNKLTKIILLITVLLFIVWLCIVVFGNIEAKKFLDPDSLISMPIKILLLIAILGALLGLVTVTEYKDIVIYFLMIFMLLGIIRFDLFPMCALLFAGACMLRPNLNRIISTI